MTPSCYLGWVYEMVMWLTRSTGEFPSGIPVSLSQEDQTNANSKTKVTQSVVYVVITCFVEIKINTNKVET